MEDPTGECPKGEDLTVGNLEEVGSMSASQASASQVVVDLITGCPVVEGWAGERLVRVASLLDGDLVVGENPPVVDLGVGARANPEMADSVVVANSEVAHLGWVVIPEVVDWGAAANQEVVVDPEAADLVVVANPEVADLGAAANPEAVGLVAIDSGAAAHPE